MSEPGDVELQGVWVNPLVARGAAYADYDQDGDVDVLLTENGGKVHLWENKTSGGNFLRVRLNGKRSNKDGLGARIEAVVGDVTMQRRVRTGSTYMSQSELTASFGLGEVTKVDRLSVYWPAGGIDVFTDLDVNQEILVEEGNTGSFGISKLSE